MKFFVSAVILAGALNSAGPDAGAPPLEVRLSALAEAGVAGSVIADARALADGIEDDAADRAALDRLRARADGGEAPAAALLARLSEEMRVREPEAGAYAAWVAVAQQGERPPVKEMARGLTRRLEIYRAYAGRAQGALETARDRLGLSGNTRTPIPEAIRRAVLTPARVRASAGGLREIAPGDTGAPEAAPARAGKRISGEEPAAAAARQRTDMAGSAEPERAPLSLVIGWDRDQARLRAAVEAAREIVPRAMSDVRAEMRRMTHPGQGEGYTLVLDGISGVNALNTICAVFKVPDCWAAQAEAGRLKQQGRPEARENRVARETGAVPDAPAGTPAPAESPAESPAGAGGAEDGEGDPVETVLGSAGIPLPSDRGVMRADPVPDAPTPPRPQSKPVASGADSAPLPDIARLGPGEPGGPAAAGRPASMPDFASEAELRADLMAVADARPEVRIEAAAIEGEELVFEVPVEAADRARRLAFRVVGGDVDLPARLRLRGEAGVRAPSRADIEVDEGGVEVPAGADRIELRIPTRQDAYAEDDESVRFALTLGGRKIGEARGRIRDDDGVARLSLARSAGVREGETARFEIRLDRPRDRATRVVWRVRALNGAVAARPENGSVRIPAGKKRAVIETALAEDARHAPEAAVQLHLLAPEAVRLDGAWPVRFAAVENDPAPGVAVELAPAREGEVMAGRVALSRPLVSAVDLTWRARVLAPEGAEVPGRDDLEEVAGRVRIPAGALEAGFRIPVRQDAVHEGPERVRVRVRALADWSESPVEAIGVIEDDDELPAARLVRAPGGIAPEAEALPVTVRLDAPAGTPLVFGWRVEALEGPRAAGEATLPAGRRSLDLEVPVDGVAGPADVRDIVLLSPAGAELDRVRVYPAAPVSAVSADPVSVPEGGILRVPVRLDPPAARWRYLPWRMWGELGQLVGSTSGTLAIPPGADRATIAVASRDDGIFDPDGGDRIELELAPAPGLEVPEAPVILELTDDEPAARIQQIDDVRLAEGERARVRLRLSRPYEAPVVMHLRQVTPGLHLGADLTGIPERVTVPAGARERALEIAARADGLHEGRERVGIEVRSGSEAVEGAVRFDVTLIDRDPRPRVSWQAPETLREGEAREVTVRLDPPSARGGWFRPRILGADAAGIDVDLPERVLVAPGARTAGFEVRYRADDRYTPPLDLTLSGRLGGRDLEGPRLQIVDGEAAPRARVQTAAGVEGSDLRFAVELDGPVSVPVRVRYGLEPGSADIGPDGDVPAVSGVLEIPAGDTRGAVRVPLRADGLDEGVERFSLVLRDWEGVANDRDMVVGGEIADPQPEADPVAFAPVVRAEMSAARWDALNAAADRARERLLKRLDSASPARRTAGSSDPEAKPDSGRDAADRADPNARAAAQDGVRRSPPPRPYCLLGSLSDRASAEREKRRVVRRLGEAALAGLDLELRRLYGGGERYIAITLSGFEDPRDAAVMCDLAASRGLSCVAKR